LLNKILFITQKFNILTLLSLKIILLLLFITFKKTFYIYFHNIFTFDFLLFLNHMDFFLVYMFIYNFFIGLVCIYIYWYKFYKNFIYSIYILIFLNFSLYFLVFASNIYNFFFFYELTLLPSSLLVILSSPNIRSKFVTFYFIF
jgi:formate hydrogenlyase subunit 3/multisubunit Na+/H+ antiporter MnhD subunit